MLKSLHIPEKVSTKSRRCLVLVSKVMQNLANGIQFGEKEVRQVTPSESCTEINGQGHMLRFNGFIKSSMPKLEAFFQGISRGPPGVPGASQTTFGFATHS